MPMQQQTIHYKTYIKGLLRQALEDVFAEHPDPILQRQTKVSSSLPQTQAQYPTVIVRFYERDLHNMGVGHHEWIGLKDPSTGEPTNEWIRFKHYGYSGDIEFAIYALSSEDRDLMADAIVQILSMGDTEAYSHPFYDRLYKPNYDEDPTAIEHFINLNSDRIMGYGESEMIAPWMPEDVLVYQTSYRIPIMGEFYSRTPPFVPLGLVSEVDLYPYDPSVGDPVPNPNPNDPSPWIGDGNEFF